MNTLCSPWLIFRVFFIPSRFILAAGSRVGNSLFRSSLFRSKSLILKRESLSLFFKKSDCEQIAPIALYKKKIVSDGSDSLFFMSELLFRSQKTSKFPTLLSTLLRKYFAICSVLLYMYITICLPSSCWIWVRNFSCVYFANRYLFAEPLPPSPSGNTF